MVIMPHWPVPLGHKPIDLDLSRIKALLNVLGNPQKKLPPVIHFAGTNGKGSTLAFTKAILQAAGYRVHSYTSPHLVCFNERIELDGKQISDDYLMEILNRCEAASKDIPVTFFEGTTAAAFLAFAENEADIVLLETGLGGRLDATNLVDEPALTVITPVSFDHIEFLGETIEAIAKEKAGIIKPSAPCVVGKQPKEALQVISRIAKEQHSDIIAYDTDWRVKPSGRGFEYKAQGKTLSLPMPSLYGEHQYDNAGLAITVMKHLQGFDIDDAAIKKGIQSARHLARMQPITEGALLAHIPEGWELWLDGGHNPDAGNIIAQAVSGWSDKPLYVMCGMLKDKNIQGFLTPIAPFIRHLAAIAIPNELQALPADAVCRKAKELNISSEARGGVEEAIKTLTASSDKPSRILICGSLYLAGHVLTINAG